MKPRNEYQRRIVKLSEKLPRLTDKQRQWAIEHCFDEDAYHTGNKAWCLHCGEIFTHKAPKLGVDVEEATTHCPNCNRELKLKSSRKCKYDERVYFSIITTCKGLQVCRHFLVEKHVRKTSHYKNCDKEPMYFISECVQNWIDEKGKETIIARNVKCMPFVYDAWDFSKPMTLKVANRSYYAPNRYDINSDYVYPISRVLSKILRNGFHKPYNRISYSEQYKLLLRDKEAEILAKNKQYDLLYYKWSRNKGEFGLPHQHSIRIAMRHKYMVNDASTWFDYLDLLDYFGKDTHNPHYVCPADLNAAHDRLLEKKRRIEDLRKKQQLIAEAKQHEEDYVNAKGKYFGVCFGNDNIRVTVIQSVSEMAEEGQDLHHCVYSMKYYNRENSLILSAKDADGNRIETIELDLSTFKVVQCRGKHNSITDKHDEIIKLVNENINLIRKIA